MQTRSIYKKFRPPPGYLDPTDAAARLGISVVTLMELVRKKDLRCFRPTLRPGERPRSGIPVYFLINDLDLWMLRSASMDKPCAI